MLHIWGGGEIPIESALIAFVAIGCAPEALGMSLAAECAL
jgi:hypothetical protein